MKICFHIARRATDAHTKIYRTRFVLLLYQIPIQHELIRNVITVAILLRDIIERILIFSRWKISWKNGKINHFHFGCSHLF